MSDCIGCSAKVRRSLVEEFSEEELKSQRKKKRVIDLSDEEDDSSPRKYVIN